MQLDSIRAFSLCIPFKAVFAHAAARRSATETLWVSAQDREGATGVGEGCPRAYVTGENLVTARAFVAAGAQEWCRSIGDVPTLSSWAAAHRADIDTHPAAWSAVELAILDLIGRTENRSVERLLGLPEIAGSFRYSAVLGDARIQAFERELATYLQAGFRDFKVKLSGDPTRDCAKVRALRAAGITGDLVRADANNLWSDAAVAIAYLEALDLGFWALEEPLCAGDYDGMRRISRALGARIILDESMRRIEDLAAIEGDAHRWVANLRVSKMGGLVRSLQFGELARCRGIEIILGAHVGETSLLTRAALAVANAFRPCVIAQEGAFGTHLLERDVVAPPLMFANGGILDTAALELGSKPGLGLEVDWSGICAKVA